MNTRAVALLSAVSMLLAISIGVQDARAKRPEDQKGKPPVSQEEASAWMKHKLDASQKILEGLTRANFDLIEKQAQSMQILGYLEDWLQADTPGYRAQLHAFEHANAAIINAAQDKNLDGVTIAYTQLTISCVQCHKVVRDVSKN